MLHVGWNMDDCAGEDFLRRAYFAFDKPVPYVVQDKVITIRPIMLDEAETFLASIDILQHDKNSSPSVEIIQMSYLEYLVKVIKPTDEYLEDKLTNILSYCGITSWAVMPDERGKLVLVDRTHDLTLSAKQFDELTKIILYQNILHYDDSYVNPEFKKTMELTDSVKNFNREFPTLERKMYIITAHTGLSKQEQMKMTFREHQGVFEECSGEVDFETTRAITMYAGIGGQPVGDGVGFKKRCQPLLLLALLVGLIHPGGLSQQQVFQFLVLGQCRLQRPILSFLFPLCHGGLQLGIAGGYPLSHPVGIVGGHQAHGILLSGVALYAM